MDEFDHINDPPGQVWRMIKGMILLGLSILGLVVARLFLVHNKNTTGSDHTGHLVCEFLHDNVLLFAAIVFGVLFWASGTDR